MGRTPTFGLIHGAWHGAWAWDKLVPKLDDAGHRAIAVDLPSDLSETYDSEAAQAAAQLADADILVGHSRAGNIVTRMVGKISVKKIIYIAGSFQGTTLRPLDFQASILPARATPQLIKGQVNGPTGYTTFNPQIARQVFYNKCSVEDADWAVAKLRPQRISIHDPSLARWPEVPQEYIICKADKAINPTWSRAVCELAGITVHELDADHSPFLSQTDELAQLLIRLAD